MSTQIYGKEIRKIMQDYIDLFPDEYLSFIEMMRTKRDNAADDWGEVEGADMIERKMFEMPTSLYAMLKARLPGEAFTWFRTKEGNRWFAKTFPKFRDTQKV